MKIRDSNEGTQWAEPDTHETEEEMPLKKDAYQSSRESTGLLDGVFGEIIFGLWGLTIAAAVIGAVVMLFMSAPWWAAIIIVLLVLVLFK